MLNTYNSVYSQILQDTFNSSWNDFTILKRFMDYPLIIKIFIPIQLVLVLDIQMNH